MEVYIVLYYHYDYHQFEEFAGVASTYEKALTFVEDHRKHVVGDPPIFASHEEHGLSDAGDTEDSWYLVTKTKVI